MFPHLRHSTLYSTWLWILTWCLMTGYRFFLCDNIFILWKSNEQNTTKIKTVYYHLQQVIIITIGGQHSSEAFGENNTQFFFVSCLFSSLSPLEKVFLFVLLLLQKPAISEIIAIVDWCGAIHFHTGWFTPHLWHNARLVHIAATDVSVRIIKIYFSVSTLIFGLYGLLLFIQYNALICTPKTKL